MQTAQPRSRARAIFSAVALWLLVSLINGIVGAFFASSFISHPEQGTLLTFFGLLPLILILTSSRPMQYLTYPAWKIALPLIALYTVIVFSFPWYPPLALNLVGPFLTLLAVAVAAQRAKPSSMPRWPLLAGCGLIGGAGAALVFWLMLGVGIISLPMLLLLVATSGLATLVGGALHHASDTFWTRFRRSRPVDASEQAPGGASAPLSRRQVLLGLGGLAGLAATGAGFTWLSRSLLAHIFPLITYKSLGKVESLSWSPDGKRIISATETDIAIWDAASGKESFTSNDYISYGYLAKQPAAWSPNGTRIALRGSAFDDRVGSPNQNVLIIDATTLRPIVTLSAGTSRMPAGVLAIAWSPDSTRIATASGEVQVWNVATGKQLLSFGTGLFVLAWSPDGRYLASDNQLSNNQYDVQVWDAENGALLTTYRGHTNFIHAVAWSPDSTKIVSGSLDSPLQVWDAQSGRHLFSYHGGDAAFTVAWSPDGTRIASAGITGDVHVWNTATGEQVFLYKGHTQEVNALAWSPDGTRIASGSVDKTVQVWQPG